MLKSGGTLVYSTCTLYPEENEGIVAEVLSENTDTLTLVPAHFGTEKRTAQVENNALKALSPNDQIQMIKDSNCTLFWDPRIFCEKHKEAKSCLDYESSADQFLQPSTSPFTSSMSDDPNNDTIGFFIAKFVKK